ncbi:MAG: PilZ domain-containing protein [Deltaproteobacteria bacterium]|nr:PilZ domain-containing protein [Deltaproteobacteria bacterium]
MSPDAKNEKERHPYHRRFVRHKVRLKVEVKSNQSYQTWTNNLSEDGVCFEIPKKLKVGTDVVIWIFVYRGKERPVRADCRVVWLSSGKKGRHLHGGQFQSFSFDGDERLKTFLAELSRPITQPPPP